MPRFPLRLTVLAAVLAASVSQAQNYNWISDMPPGQIQQDEIDLQIEGLLKVFSSLSGAGFVNTAALHKVGGLDVRFSLLGAPVPENLRDIVPGIADPLENEEYATYGVVHGNLGLLPRLEAYGRFFTLGVRGEPKTGNVTLVGGGLKYGILEESPGTPALVFMGGYQALIVPEEFDFGDLSSWSLKAYLSKSFPALTLYGGGGFDYTKLNLTVPDLPPEIDEEYDLFYPQGTVGAAFHLLPFLNINLDANRGGFWSFTAGAAFSVR